MASTLPTRGRFVLVQGVLMYGLGLSLLFTIGMLIAFREQGAKPLEVFGIGAMVLCPIGALWGFFYYEQFARRHYARLRQQQAAQQQERKSAD